MGRWGFAGYLLEALCDSGLAIWVLMRRSPVLAYSIARGPRRFTPVRGSFATFGITCRTIRLILRSVSTCVPQANLVMESWTLSPIRCPDETGYDKEGAHWDLLEERAWCAALETFDSGRADRTP